MIRFLLAVFAVAASVMACGTPGSDSSGSAGWRRGRVVQVGDATVLPEIQGGDCRHRAEADGLPSGRYVEIQYFVGRHAHLRIVPLAEEADVVPGDAVFFKPGSCIEAVVH